MKLSSAVSFFLDFYHCYVFLCNEIPHYFIQFLIYISSGLFLLAGIKDTAGGLMPADSMRVMIERD